MIPAAQLEARHTARALERIQKSIGRELALAAARGGTGTVHELEDLLLEVDRRVNLYESRGGHVTDASVG